MKELTTLNVEAEEQILTPATRDYGLALAGKHVRSCGISPVARRSDGAPCRFMSS